MLKATEDVQHKGMLMLVSQPAGILLTSTMKVRVTVGIFLFLSIHPWIAH